MRDFTGRTVAHNLPGNQKPIDPPLAGETNERFFLNANTHGILDMMMSMAMAMPWPSRGAFSGEEKI